VWPLLQLLTTLDHEILWLEGSFDYINKRTDTKESRENIVHQLKSGIMSGGIVGAHIEQVGGIPYLFTHAGLRPAMVSQINRNFQAEGRSLSTISVTDYDQLINLKLLEAVQPCANRTSSTCNFGDELFQAGPERHGTSIGGPFWTDFQILKDCDKSSEFSAQLSFVQIVGHTIERNKIRVTEGLSAVCVDAGMYLGGRAYLEIFSATGAVLTHARRVDGGNLPSIDIQNTLGSWDTVDLTAQLCT
jgi:hypothetical protein